MNVPKLRAPIVLVHGLFGFDRLQLYGWTLANYFPGIPELFQEAGNQVLVARISPTGGIADRAAELAALLNREMPKEPVHIIAHSMGGLDSRYLISRLGFADRVLSLTTIGTPHRGTAFADWGISRLERFLKPLLDAFGIPHRAFYDLTTTNCQAFNQEVLDVPSVRYFSVAGQHEGSWLTLEWEMSRRIVTQLEGPNDGVVSVASATYGENCEIWDGDHFSLVNWLKPISQLRGTWQDRRPGYATLLRRLADEGF